MTLSSDRSLPSAFASCSQARRSRPPSTGEIEYGYDFGEASVQAVSMPPRSTRSSGRSLPSTSSRSRRQVAESVWMERTVRRSGSAACRSICRVRCWPSV